MTGMAETGRFLQLEGGTLNGGVDLGPAYTPVRFAAYDDGTGLATAQCREPHCRWMLRGCGDLTEAMAVVLGHIGRTHRRGAADGNDRR